MFVWFKFCSFGCFCYYFFSFFLLSLRFRNIFCVVFAKLFIWFNPAQKTYSYAAAYFTKVTQNWPSMGNEQRIPSKFFVIASFDVKQWLAQWNDLVGITVIWLVDFVWVMLTVKVAQETQLINENKPHSFHFFPTSLKVRSINAICWESQECLLRIILWLIALRDVNILRLVYLFFCLFRRCMRTCW